MIDQFEQLFTLAPPGNDSAKAAARFVNTLLPGTQRANSALQVVVTLRVDFFGLCYRYPDLWQLLSQHHYPVRRMDPGRLREVIEKPMAIVGVPLDSGLADMMIEDAGAQPGALALLDHALDQLWRECKGEVPTYTHYTRCPEVLHLRLLSDAAIRPVVRASESFRFPPASRCARETKRHC